MTFRAYKNNNIDVIEIKKNALDCIVIFKFKNNITQIIIMKIYSNYL